MYGIHIAKKAGKTKTTRKKLCYHWLSYVVHDRLPIFMTIQANSFGLGRQVTGSWPDLVLDTGAGTSEW